MSIYEIIEFYCKKRTWLYGLQYRFFEDLNFLAGLNGTGKTTTLNLIIALFTPSIKKLANTEFEYIEMIFSDEQSIISKISCSKNNKKLTFEYNSKFIEIDLNGFRIDDDNDIFYKLKSHEVLDEISKIATPMFLDLNRRFVKNSRMDLKVEEKIIILMI